MKQQKNFSHQYILESRILAIHIGPEDFVYYGSLQFACGIQGHCGGLIPDFYLSRTSILSDNVEIILDKIQAYKIRFYYNDSRAKSSMIRALETNLKAAFSDRF